MGDRSPWWSRLRFAYPRHMPGLSPGRRSLRRHLLLWLLLPQLVLWLAAATFTYRLADSYANRIIDASLTTASRALARQVKPIGTGLYIDFPRAARDIIEADPEDRVFYTVSTPPGEFILGNSQVSQPPNLSTPPIGQPYVYDGRVTDPSIERRGHIEVRVVALYLSYGDAAHPQTMLVQVARSRASREALARQILIDTALPLSVLIVLMSVIVWGGIRGGLAPLARLRSIVESRKPNDLAPVRLDAAPEEVRSLAKALNALLAQVSHSVATQRRFISDAAHQLRTPLAGLKSQTELALTSATAANDPVLRARLERVNESATRSARLVGQLLVLARAEPEAALAQSRTRFDLARLAREVAAEYVPRALLAGIDLGSSEPEPDAPPRCVTGNALLIREAIANLVDNAIRYAGRGAVITLSVHASGTDVVLVVEDNGAGLEPGDLERVFQRFARATHEGNGCGLGLAIVREIVERSRGEVTLQTAQPHGLRAVVRLPAA